MEPQLPLPHNIVERRRTLTYRVRGIPLNVDITALQKGLELLLETQDVRVDSLALSSIGRQGQVATIRVTGSAKLPDTHDEWRIPTGRTLVVDVDTCERTLVIDTHFQGFTPLYSPASDTDHSLDCIAISGLGSHAFGSWKDRNSHYMWLRDTLPYDLPGARVLTYGYDTGLAKSNNFQNLEDVAKIFCVSLRIALGSRPPDIPLIFIAHSLGGLVLKQALIQIASGDGVDRRIFESTYGILFFGVPNQGMDISSLLAMVGSQPNLPFLTMLSKDSGNLQGLVERFRTVFDFKDSETISFYETCASRTARKDTTGRWSMSGDHAVLVDRFSAKSGRSWEESHSFLQPISRNHSEMVKFSEYDDLGVIVGNYLTRFARIAPAVIRSRVDRLDSSTTSDPSDARPLAFRPQPGEEASMDEPGTPLEAEHKDVKLGMDTGRRSDGEKGLKVRHQEAGNKVVNGESKRPASSSSDIRENEDYLRMFANAGFDMEVQTSRNQGLSWAARNGHFALVVLLISKGADLIARGRENCTLLMLAAQSGHMDVVKTIIERQKRDANQGVGWCLVTAAFDPVGLAISGSHFGCWLLVLAIFGRFRYAWLVSQFLAIRGISYPLHTKSCPYV